MPKWVDVLDSVNQKYDNTLSGLVAVDAQSAIDEVAANVAAKEDYLGVPVADGYVLTSTVVGVRTWVSAGGAGVVWGDITGILANQTDLQAALDAKASLASNNQFTGDNQFLGEFNVGDPGTEANGVVLDGITYPSIGKFNRFGTGNTAELVIHRHSTTDGSNLVFSRALSNDATHANVVNGTVLGDVRFTGWGDSSYWSGASIKGVVDGVPGVSDMPTKLDFLTTPDGAFVSVLRMSIRADGTIDIAGDINMGVNTITDAKVATWDAAEPGLGNPATNGYLLSSTVAGVRSWVPPGTGNVSTPDAAAEGSVNITNIVGLTQVEYDGSVKNANTLYIIVG